MPKLADSIIRYSFYLLFFLVPLIFFSVNFELFEYNKMMLTYAFTIVIATAWLIKIILNSKFKILNSVRRTPFDIPILIYLASHVLSTIFSIDLHTSLWGYYSRFHEGLFATLSYIILYYAAVSNLNKRDVTRIFLYSFASGVIVSLWGAMEHFGASPSCAFITGKFDDACWVQDVKGRVFATLGQPNWMAAYLNVLIIIAIGFTVSIKNFKFHPPDWRIKFPALAGLFFATLMFTKSRSGILGLIVGLAMIVSYALYSSFWGGAKSDDSRIAKVKNQIDSGQARMTLKIFGILFACFALLALSFGLPFSQIEKLNLENIITQKSSSTVNREPKTAVNPGYIDIGISESGDIRKIVWKGALKIWQRYPIFGSGVETFAYAYYADRPVEHNMVSEWDFLYNKAHNEFLNILATTGTIGTIAYLLLIAAFVLWCLKTIFNFKFLIFNENFKFQISNSKTDFHQQDDNKILIAALLAAYASILVTNFFGFSVVIIGLFFFLIPAFSLIISEENSHSGDDPPAGGEDTRIANVKHQRDSGHLPAETSVQAGARMTVPQWIFISLLVLIGLIGLWRLWGMWQADKSFAYGKNLDSVSQFTQAYQYLNEAVTQIPDEPVYRDELSYNEAVLAVALFNQATGSAQEKLNAPYGSSNISAATLVQKAISDSNQTIQASPNILQFWKTRTKVFYQLSTIDKQYFPEALNSIQKAVILAPTDAKVHYNFGLLLGQSGQILPATRIMEQTVAMKPDYADAHYALGLYYDSAGRKQEARKQMEFILKKIGNDTRAKKWLSENP